MAASETEEDLDIKAALQFEALEHKRKANLKYLYNRRYAAFYYRSKTASAKRNEALEELKLDIQFGKPVALEDDEQPLDF